MLSLLVIWLTVVAWRKGWGARALLPLAVSLVAGIILGVVIGAGGGSEKDARLFFFLGNLICLAVLGYLAAVKPAPARLTVLPIAEEAINREEAERHGATSASSTR